MLESFKVENFQSHKDTGCITLDPNVNVFTGPSDNGKSALIRALTLLLTNNPSGTEFISDWMRKGKASFTGNTEVSAVIDGKNITRIRGKDNQYIIGGKQLEAFGVNIPEEIEDLANLKDFNIQSQDQTFFLLDRPAGEVAKQINDMVDMEIIDTAMSNIDKMVRSTNASKKVVNDTIKEWEEKENDFLFLDRVRPLLEKAEELSAQKTAMEHKLSTLIALSASIKDIQNKQDHCKDIVHQKKLLGNVQQAHKNMMDVNTKCKLLQSMQKDLATINSMKDTCQSKMGHIEKIGNMLDIKDNIKEVEAKIKTFSQLHTNLLDIKGEIEDTGTVIQELNQGQSDIGLENCPVCGADIKGD